VAIGWIRWACPLRRSGEERKHFFFEKKSAPALREPKNFCDSRLALSGKAAAKPIRSFLLLFFKKEGLAFALLS
jgi:hypothetical protein